MAKLLEDLKGTSLTQYLIEREMLLIAKALHAAEGNCARAAKSLGIKRTDLVMRRKRLGFLMKR